MRCFALFERANAAGMPLRGLLTTLERDLTPKWYLGETRYWARSGEIKGGGRFTRHLTGQIGHNKKGPRMVRKVRP